MTKEKIANLISSMLEGDEIAVAKLISLIENEDLGREIIPAIHKQANNTYTIGITGPPGVGKSTLTEKLVLQLLEKDSKIGILAIDPTSPFTGGALLGDRIRLQKLSTDPRIFIRSMASRGYLGGISAATLDAAKLFEAFGCNYIIIETVGVGQSEVEIVQHVDTTILVLSPGLGDDIQALKAGIMEIADIFVINKADREGVERSVSEIEMLLKSNTNMDYIPPIVKTIARDNTGIDELLAKLDQHRTYLRKSGLDEKNRKKRIRFELWHRINSLVSQKITNLIETYDVDEIINDIYEKRTDSYSVADRIIKKLMS